MLHPEAKMPTRGSERSAGHDIYTIGSLENLDANMLDKLGDEDPFQLEQWEKMGHDGYILIPRMEGFLFRTGIQMAIQEGHLCCLWDRSGLGGIKNVHRFAGVIDEDYRGEWFVRLFNFSGRPMRINVGAKIIQGVFHERIEAEFPDVGDGPLPETARGQSGFGSTGE